MELEFLEVEFHTKKICVITPYQVQEPYSGFFKSYNDILKPYIGVFLQFITRVSRRFFSTSNSSAYKSRLKNSSFILELEF